MNIDLTTIVNKLDDQKGDFIEKCRQEIESKVSAMGSRSLSLVEVGVRTYRVALDEYLVVLWKFRSNEKYHGY